MQAAPKFYLVTLVEPFFAPDGKRYMAVFGVGHPGTEDDSSLIHVGNTLIPADSIHMIVQTTTIPPIGSVTEYVTADGDGEYRTRPSLIYVCPPED